MPGLREALLPFTIRNAARLRFYMESWHGVDANTVLSIADLPKLPTLTKADYRRSLMYDELAVSDSAYITHTTGTTGPLTWRHRSLAEASIIGQLFADRTEPPTSDLALTFRYDHHGMALPVPGRIRAMPIGLSDEAELKQCVEMLTASYRFADGILRPTIITGSARDVAVLAQAWIEAGRPEGILPVHTLYLMGFVDSGLYRFLTATFPKAQVIEKYSLTEIFGGATRIWPSQQFILDPYVVGEVVDDLGMPVPPGVAGELALTELFPFVQMQPLIRYRTGDIALALHSEGDTALFEWWGRRSSCIEVEVNGKRVWAMGYSRMADWLSRQPIVARHRHKPGLSSLVSTDFGEACFTLDNKPEAIELDIGLRINPWWEVDATIQLARELWDALRLIAIAPMECLRLRLRFRHVRRPPDDYTTLTGGPAMEFMLARLSDSVPSVRVLQSQGQSCE